MPKSEVKKDGKSPQVFKPPPKRLGKKPRPVDPEALASMQRAIEIGTGVTWLPETDIKKRL